ncbi:sulfate transporter family-domain-containing protein [Phlyctochytrium arcticum]|nr:sulfate transporter family-domain-containing protein [Phlyctochytrium arcticum]
MSYTDPRSDTPSSFQSDSSRWKGPSSLETSPLLAGRHGCQRDGSEEVDSRRNTEWYALFRIRLRYYVPVVGWLPKYDWKHNLQSDILAGITVASLVVPQGLSYAQALLKIPPIYGLYTASIPLLVYGLLGTSRQIGLGPEALISILVAATIKDITGKPDLALGENDDRQQEAIAISIVLAFLVGIFTFLLGFFRLGFLDSVLSRALLRGFILAVAMVVMIDMSDILLGIPASPPNGNGDESPIEKLIDTLANLGLTNVLTASLSACSIAFLAGMKMLKARYSTVRWLQVMPEILVLVVVTTVLCQTFRWDLRGVAILNVKNATGSGESYPRFPELSLSRVRQLLTSASLISVIGFVESIVVAKTYATKHSYSVSPNRELVAIGVSNIVGSLFGAYPAFGSLGRSAVNNAAGAVTQVAGFSTGIVVLCTRIWLLDYFQFLPRAVCSSIITVAAMKLVELEDVQFMLRLRAWKDVGLLLLTFLTTLFISIQSGTLLSVGISLLLVIKHTTKTRLAILGHIAVVDPHTGDLKTKYKSIHDSDKVQSVDDILIIRIEEGLFFGNCGQLKDRLKRVEVYGDLGVHPGEEPRRAPTRVPSRLQLSNEIAENTENAHVGTERMAERWIHAVVFDFGAVTDIDASATLTLLEIVDEYLHRGIEVCFVKLRRSCRDAFLRSGLYDRVGPARFFKKIRHAIAYLEANSHSPNTAPSDDLLTFTAATGSSNIQVLSHPSSSTPGETDWTVPDKQPSLLSSPPGSYFPSYLPDALDTYQGEGAKARQKAHHLHHV